MKTKEVTIIQGYELGILFRFSFHVLIIEFVYIFLALFAFQINGPLFIVATLLLVSCQTVYSDNATIRVLPSMVVQTLRVWINIVMFLLSSSLLSVNNNRNCSVKNPCTGQELKSRFGPLLATMVSVVALYFTNIACLSLFRSIHHFGLLIWKCAFELYNIIRCFISDDCVDAVPTDEELHPLSPELSVEQTDTI